MDVAVESPIGRTLVFLEQIISLPPLHQLLLSLVSQLYLNINYTSITETDNGLIVDNPPVVDLSGDEEDSVVFKILELGGITINKPGLVQIAAQKEQVESQTQKQ